MTDDTGTMLWGFKFLNVDLTTDDHRGGRLRYRLGEWMDADPQGRKFTRGGLCPAFPGDGLCVARTLAGAQSGGARIGSSTLVLVGYRPDDVLCAGGDKLRVKRLFVHPDPQDPKAWLIGPGADLRAANLRDANLRDANLRDANLRDANLRHANLWGANLLNSDLRYANLRAANLRYSDLRYSVLLDADLEGANLRYANLRGANLQGANLQGADLRDAYLGAADRPSWLPQRWGVDERGFVFEAPLVGASASEVE